MKRFIAFLTCLLVVTTSLLSQDGEGLWMNAGPYHGGFLGKGLKENYFDPGLGAKFSVGIIQSGKFNLAYYSLSFFRSKNHVLESTLQTTVFHHSFEVFRNFGEKQIKPFAVFGLGAGVIKMDNVEGVDRYFYVPLGLGLHWAKKNFTLDLSARIFGAFGNQFGQKFGYETGFQCGLVL